MPPHPRCTSLSVSTLSDPDAADRAAALLDFDAAHITRGCDAGGQRRRTTQELLSDVLGSRARVGRSSIHTEAVVAPRGGDALTSIVARHATPSAAAASSTMPHHLPPPLQRYSDIDDACSPGAARDAPRAPEDAAPTGLSALSAALSRQHHTLVKAFGAPDVAEMSPVPQAAGGARCGSESVSASSSARGSVSVSPAGGYARGPQEVPMVDGRGAAAAAASVCSTSAGLSSDGLSPLGTESRSGSPSSAVDTAAHLQPSADGGSAPPPPPPLPNTSLDEVLVHGGYPGSSRFAASAGRAPAGAVIVRGGGGGGLAAVQRVEAAAAEVAEGSGSDNPPACAGLPPPHPPPPPAGMDVPAGSRAAVEASPGPRAHDMIAQHGPPVDATPVLPPRAEAWADTTGAATTPARGTAVAATPGAAKPGLLDEILRMREANQADMADLTRRIESTRGDLASLRERRRRRASSTTPVVSPAPRAGSSGNARPPHRPPTPPRGDPSATPVRTRSPSLVAHARAVRDTPTADAHRHVVVDLVDGTARPAAQADAARTPSPAAQPPSWTARPADAPAAGRPGASSPAPTRDDASQSQPALRSGSAATVGVTSHSSRGSGSGSMKMTRYEALYQHSIEIMERRARTREQATQEQLAECTFQPRITKFRARRSGSGGAAPRDSGPASTAGSVSVSPRAAGRRAVRGCSQGAAKQTTAERRLEEELRQCTFVPNLTAVRQEAAGGGGAGVLETSADGPSYNGVWQRRQRGARRSGSVSGQQRRARSSSPSASRSVSTHTIPGFDQTVKRMKDARDVREAAHPHGVPPTTARWTPEVTVPEPFDLCLPARRGRGAAGGDNTAPLVYVDVTIGRTAQLSGRIGIRASDTPSSLVASFAEAYKLDARQREKLYHTIHTTMLQHVPGYREREGRAVVVSP